MKNQKIFEAIDQSNAPLHSVARHNLFVYSLLFNKEIEPAHDYTDKFFTVLSYEFQKFLTSPFDLMLLEAAPRTGKTEFVINIFLSQQLGVQSNQRFLLVASNQGLKKQLRRQVERVIKTNLFNKMFPAVRIVVNNDAEMILSNGNIIMFTTTNSSVPIGMGFHWIFLIDFLNSDTMRSEALREESFAQLRGFMSRTQHNPVTKFIVDNQRLGINDLSAYFVGNYQEMGIGYHRLTFPYQFSDDYYYHLGGSRSIKFKAGDYLVSRFNEIAKKQLIAKFGAYVYETQYLQAPRAARGDLIKREMFRYYKQHDLQNKKFIRGFITTDLALEAKRHNDYNVYCFWLIDEEYNLYLIDMLRLKIKGLESEQALYNFYLKWKDGLKNGGAGVHYITFENTTNSKMTIQRYKNGFELGGGEKIILGGIVKELSRTKDKCSRLIDALPLLEAGRVFIPSFDVKIDGVQNVNDEIIEPLLRECENFREDDTHDFDDVVDNLTDAINEARKPEPSLRVEF